MSQRTKRALRAAAFLSLLALGAALWACAVPGGLVRLAPGSEARNYATVTLEAPGITPSATAAYRLKGAYGFEDQRIAYLRLTAQGADFAKITQDLVWAPGVGPIPLRLQVPLGTNRVFTLSALDAAKHPLITMKGMASLTAASHVVSIHGGTIPGADALEQVIRQAPAVAPKVNMTNLQALMDGLTGYVPETRAFVNGEVNSTLVAASLIASDGAVPALSDPATPSFAPGVSASLSVLAQDAASNAIASGVRFILSDPLSDEVLSDASASPTVIASAAYGLWTLTALHPTYGAVEQEVLLPYASGTLTVRLTPEATGAKPSTFQNLFFSQVKHPFPGGFDGSDSVGRFAPGLWPKGVAGPLAAHGDFAYVGEGTRIRKVFLLSGEISTLAGGTVPGTVDGTGTSARFTAIRGLACDASGSFLYVTDDNRIRRVSLPTGQVQAWAGKLEAGNADDADRLQATFRGPGGLTLDASGTLWVADTGNNAIRQIDAAGVTKVMDATQPLAVVVASPSLFVATAENRVYERGYGSTVLLAGASPTGGYFDGPLLSAEFSWAQDPELGTPTAYLALDPSAGFLYVSDRFNHCIRRIPLPGSFSSYRLFVPPMTETVAGDRVGALKDGVPARMLGPAGLAWRGSDLLLFDQGNARLRQIDPANGAVSHLAGVGLSGFVPGPAQAFSFQALYELALNPRGNMVYALDPFSHRVAEFNLESGLMSALAGSGVQGNGLSPSQFHLGADSRLIHDRTRDVLYATVRNGSGYDLRQLTLSMPSEVAAPHTGLTRPELILSPDGSRLYTADGYLVPGTTTWGFTAYASGTLPVSDRLVGELSGDLLIARDSTGGEVVFDHIVRRNLTTSTETHFAGTVGTAGALDGLPGTGTLKNPRALVPDALGNYLYLVEDNPGLRRIRVSDGALERVWTQNVQVRGISVDDDGSLLLNVDGQGLVRAK